jgi:putative GTP pyrophosphokinase
MVIYSKSQVVKAGKLLRRRRLGGPPLSPEDYAKAMAALHEWRARHSYPLQKATMGLRQRVAGEHCDTRWVSQRLKRKPTIIDKLAREPTMQLTTMQDIAGCRVVLDSVDEVRRVEKRWRKKSGPVIRVDDYITEPKLSGYRGVHLIVTYDGFQVEVQLRTRLQHYWGTAIEDVGPVIGADLKSGQGPPEVLKFFQNLGGFLAEAEAPVAGVTKASYDALRVAAEGVPATVLDLIGLTMTPTGFSVSPKPPK